MEEIEKKIEDAIIESVIIRFNVSDAYARSYIIKDYLAPIDLSVMEDCYKLGYNLGIETALKEAAKEASLIRYFPPEISEDNYEASYISPYVEDSGCFIVIDKQSILSLLDKLKIK